MKHFVLKSQVRRYVISHRTRSSLVETHEFFLNMVMQHGEGEVQTVQHDRFTELIINNPTKRNAISGRMMLQFAQIVDDLVPVSSSGISNDRVGVILRGSGRDAFSAGADLNLVKDIVNTPQKGGLMSMFMTDALNRLYQSPLISVCVLNGPALGGGAELTTSCDFRIMPADSKVYVQFVHAKIGASPGWGGAHRLTQLVGRREALRMIGTSPRVCSTEAQHVKYADQIIEPYVSSYCSKKDITARDANTDLILENPGSADEYFREAGVRFLQPYLEMQYPGSVRAIKQAITAADLLDTDSARAVEMDMFKQRWGGTDNQSALRK